MPHLKPRKHTDPLVEVEPGVIRPLSELEPNYLELAESAKRRVNTDHVARLLVNPETKRIIEDGLTENQQIMPLLLERPHIPDEAFKSAIDGNFASLHKKVDILWAA